MYCFTIITYCNLQVIIEFGKSFFLELIYKHLAIIIEPVFIVLYRSLHVSRQSESVSVYKEAQKMVELLYMNCLKTHSVCVCVFIYLGYI